MLARGIAVETGTHVVSPGDTKTSFSVQSKPGMAPTARLLVYCIKKDGEVVVDTLNIKIDDPFQNQVRIFKCFVHVTYDKIIGGGRQVNKTRPIVAMLLLPARCVRSTGLANVSAELVSI